MEKEEEKLKRAEEMLGRINLADVDRDEDLIWALADLWNIEKHLNQAINNVVEKLNAGEDVEYNEKLLQLLQETLKMVREERAKHLPRIYYLKEFGLWCTVKHLVGAMMQFGEVGAKDIHMALEEKDEQRRKELLELAKRDFETSKTLHDILLMFKVFSKNTKPLTIKPLEEHKPK
jgi:2-methylisocitrate lyase-like PEP mutase family enzyme